MTGRSRSDKRTYRHTSRKNHSQWIHQLCLAASKQARTCFCRREKVADIIFLSLPLLQPHFVILLPNWPQQLPSPPPPSDVFFCFFFAPGIFFPLFPLSHLSLSFSMTLNLFFPPFFPVYTFFKSMISSLSAFWAGSYFIRFWRQRWIWFDFFVQARRRSVWRRKRRVETLISDP